MNVDLGALALEQRGKPLARLLNRVAALAGPCAY
jgi:hypothetical protein